MADVQPTSDQYADEQWKPIVGYEGSYEVSDMGRVRSLDRTVLRSGHEMKIRGRMLKPFRTCSSGHQSVALSRNKFLVHRLVMAAFVGPCEDGDVVCHNNGDPTDNRLSNLRYDTQSGNMYDKRHHGTDVKVNRQVCPRGHALRIPNLVPSHMGANGDHRDCLACNRAKSVIRNHPGEGISLQALSDEKYSEIMGGK